MENILCKYGCGQVARFQLKNGSMSCSKNPSSCPSIRKKFSESNCMKRPEMRIIAGNAMRGKKRDPEVIKIVAEKLRGRKHSEETKKKISFKTKGRIIPAHQRQMMIDNNPMKNIETINKMRESKKGFKHTQEFKDRLSVIMKEKFNQVEYRLLFSKKSKENFSNPKYLEKLQKSLHLKPNKPESIIINVLKELDLEKFKYTGNYSFWIDGRNPDFTCIEENRVIEYFGGWWHDENIIQVSKEDHEKEKIDHYLKNGYKCLVIWEEDLKDLNIVIEKIKNFIRT